MVERAHHHALWNRVPDYKTEWLAELQADARIYEFWTRDSGFMPMDEFRYSLTVQQSFSKRWEIPAAERRLMLDILDRIGRDGPLRAKDFDNDRTTASSGWWDWRPSKVALERLHMTGELLATRQPDFHKVYDLTRNLVPGDIDKTPPTLEEFTRHLILRTLRCEGIAHQKEISWNARFVKPPVKDLLKEMTDSGEVTEVNIDGLKGPYYMLPAYKKKLPAISAEVFILSPFDTMNVFRHRLRDFFDFDYQVECFVPAPKRKYGYFSLPILSGDKYIARMDAKAERKSGTLLINNLHFEKVKLDTETEARLVKSITRYADFNNCSELKLLKCNSRSFTKALKQNT